MTTHLGSTSALGKPTLKRKGWESGGAGDTCVAADVQILPLQSRECASAYSPSFPNLYHILTLCLGQVSSFLSRSALLCESPFRLKDLIRFGTQTTCGLQGLHYGPRKFEKPLEATTSPPFNVHLHLALRRSGN